MNSPTVQILVGDSLALLRTLPADSIHCVVTSPPYWGLRDYGVAGQMGLEPTPEEYIVRMVELFSEVRRVLRPDGTLWMNMGDSYATGTSTPSKDSQMATNPDNGHLSSDHKPAGWSNTAKTGRRRCNGTASGYKGAHADDPMRAKSGAAVGPLEQPNRMPQQGLKPKDLVGMPWRLALALQADGWYLRQDLIWHKSNPMPESVTDRCTKAHEYLFLLTKSTHYYYDAFAIRECSTNTGRTSIHEWRQAAVTGGRLPSKMPDGWKSGSGTHGTIHSDGREHGQRTEIAAGRNRRSVWTIPSHAFPLAHFATFPPALVEPCILAGTSARGCCPTCGAPWKRETNSEQVRLQDTDNHDKRELVTRWDREKWPRTSKRTNTTGWLPTCKCPISPLALSLSPCVVLDPFGGAGTTGLIAAQLGRSAILLELNPDYAAMARRRIAPALAQPDLFHGAAAS